MKKSQITLDSFSLVPESNTSVMHQCVYVSRINEMDLTLVVHQAYNSQRDLVLGGEIRVKRKKLTQKQITA